MMSTLKLFMVMLGCKPNGRHTEQHDIFFGIGKEVKDLVPAIIDFWPDANGKIHLDAYRAVNFVDGWHVGVSERTTIVGEQKLFFLNLGGYTKGVFDEAHHKMLIIANDEKQAVAKAKNSEFFKKFNAPHVDDKYGLDVDDIFEVTEVLNSGDKSKYSIIISPVENSLIDEIVLGYMPIHKL